MGDIISSLLFQPPPPTYLSPSRHFYLQSPPPSSLSPGPKSGASPSPPRQIPAFYISRDASVTILFSHGNAEDLGMIYDWFVTLAQELNVNVLAYDYTGYGKSRGVRGGNAEEEASNIPTEER